MPTLSTLRQKSFVSIVNKKHIYIGASKNYLNNTKESPVGKSVSQVWGADISKKYIIPNLKQAFLGKNITIEKWFKFKNNSNQFYQIKYHPVFSKNNTVKYVVVTTRNLTNLKLFEKNFFKSIYTDFLTNSYNRKKFVEDIKLKLKQKQPFTLVFIDLDNFAQVNNTYGHNMGDFVLEKISKLLKKQFVNSDLYRVGGDEFIVISKLNTQKINKLLKSAKTKLSSFSNKNKLGVGLSSGVIFVNDYNASVKALLEQADKLMYLQKKSKKNKQSFS